MRREVIRLAVGLAAVSLVTAVLAGAVAASAAMTHEVTDGDRCETGGDSGDVTERMTPENVTILAEDVTSCIADGASGGEPPTGGG